MVQIIEPVPVDKREEMLDKKALMVFNRCLEILGGPRKLFNYKRLTWLPSLMEAAYVAVLSGEENKTAKEIAEKLGIATQTVRNIMNANAEAVESKIKALLEGESLEEEKKTHTAGGLAKLAYKKLREEGAFETLEEKAEKVEDPVEEKAMQVFLKAIDILGGSRKLFDYRRLTWLPSLMEAAYVIVLANESGKTQSEIAEELGIATQTVRNIMNANAEAVESKIKALLEGESLEEEKKTHTAGGLAKLAYEKLKGASSNTTLKITV